MSESAPRQGFVRAAERAADPSDLSRPSPVRFLIEDDALLAPVRAIVRAGKRTGPKGQHSGRFGHPKRRRGAEETPA